MKLLIEFEDEEEANSFGGRRTIRLAALAKLTAMKFSVAPGTNPLQAFAGEGMKSMTIELQITKLLQCERATGEPEYTTRLVRDDRQSTKTDGPGSPRSKLPAVSGRKQTR